MCAVCFSTVRRFCRPAEGSREELPEDVTERRRVRPPRQAGPAGAARPERPDHPSEISSSSSMNQSFKGPQGPRGSCKNTGIGRINFRLHPTRSGSPGRCGSRSQQVQHRVEQGRSCRKTKVRIVGLGLPESRHPARRGDRRSRTLAPLCGGSLGRRTRENGLPGRTEGGAGGGDHSVGGRGIAGERGDHGIDAAAFQGRAVGLVVAPRGREEGDAVAQVDGLGVAR